MAAEQMLQHTYRVEFTDDLYGPQGSCDVNLSFEMDADLNPLDRDGRLVTQYRAQAELKRRLLKLALRNQLDVDLGDGHVSWDARLVRRRLIRSGR